MRKALLPLIGAILVLAILLAGLAYRDGYVAPWNDAEGSFSALVSPGAGGIRSTIEQLLLPVGKRVLALGANADSIEGVGELVSGTGEAPENTGEDIAFSETLYPYRAMLSKDQQSVYNQAYANALSLNEGYFTLSESLTEAELIDVMSALINDQPGLFFLETRYSYGYLSNGSVVSLKLEYNRTAGNIATYRAAFETAAKDVVAAASKLSSDVEKEKYVHDYLMDGVSYDQSAALNQSAYSALVLGQSVCAGYSRAFQYLLMQLGIPCYYCEGTVDGGNHAWNIVLLGGGYYHVDTSWDDVTGDAYGQTSYAYFNLTDKKIGADHARRGLSVNLPACQGTALSYEAAFGDSSNVPSASGSSKLPSYQKLGFTSGEVITSLAGYYDYCERSLTSAGAGTHTLEMVVQNIDLLNEIYDSIRSEDYIGGYAQSVATNLGLTGCSITLKVAAEYLADGYILLSQTTTLTGEKATPAPTATPAAAPTAVPTPQPTAVPTDTAVPYAPQDAQAFTTASPGEPPHGGKGRGSRNDGGTPQP